MRKMLIVCAALALCAGPALAQQQLQDRAGAAAGAAVTSSPAPQASPAEQRQPAPSLYVSMDEVRRQVQAAEEERNGTRAQVGSQNFLYLVAAIIVGVIVAALILD